MSWIVEQSENASAIHLNGNTVTCTKESFYDSPVNVMFNDPVDRNGQYFWEWKFTESKPGTSSSGIGLTTMQAFQAGYMLKAMYYSGNLSDGSALLVQSFGDSIKEGDKVGLLLQLTDSDMKVYLFHNEQPLGLAFHVSTPYSKPLYPMVSFNSNGKVTVVRSEQIPKSLERISLENQSVEGKWKVIDFPQHLECIGCEFKIQREDHNDNKYFLFLNVVNMLHCGLEHNPKTNEWKSTGVLSTLMAGPVELMNEEQLFFNFLSNINSIQLENERTLIIRSANGVQTKLERCTLWAPSAVTVNIFS